MTRFAQSGDLRVCNIYAAAPSDHVVLVPACDISFVARLTYNHARRGHPSKSFHTEMKCYRNKIEHSKYRSMHKSVRHGKFNLINESC